MHACICYVHARQSPSLFVASVMKCLWTVFKALTLDRALFAEQFACMIVMGLWLGGPLFCFFTPLLLCLFGTATQLCYFLVVALVLALHPLPNMEEYLNKSAFSMWLCKFLCFCLHLLMSALAPFLRVLRLPPSPPLPSDAHSTGRLTDKYFSYRIMWSGDAYSKAQASAPWVGAAGPHSVMPFGSVLSIP